MTGIQRLRPATAVAPNPKFWLSSQDQEELLADCLPHTQTIQIPHPPPAVPECRDPMDRVFTQLAVAGLPKVRVSG